MGTIASLVILVALAGCATQPTTTHAPGTAALDADVQRLMQREHVEGLALAVIDHGNVAHVVAYGRRNVERDLPLTTDTVLGSL